MNVKTQLINISIISSAFGGAWGGLESGKGFKDCLLTNPFTGCNIGMRSLLEGIGRPQQLIRRAKSLWLQAFAGWGTATDEVNIGLLRAAWWSCCATAELWMKSLDSGGSLSNNSSGVLQEERTNQKLRLNLGFQMWGKKITHTTERLQTTPVDRWEIICPAWRPRDRHEILQANGWRKQADNCQEQTGHASSYFFHYFAAGSVSLCDTVMRHGSSESGSHYH